MENLKLNHEGNEKKRNLIYDIHIYMSLVAWPIDQRIKNYKLYAHRSD